VVDDASTDGSLEILREIRTEAPGLLLLAHPVNQGKGMAIRTALAHVTGNVVAVQDADLEYDPRELLRGPTEYHSGWGVYWCCYFVNTMVQRNSRTRNGIFTFQDENVLGLEFCVDSQWRFAFRFISGIRSFCFQTR
jgi:glycosyltransferase involved in cell wall biosynthesis